MKKYLLFLILFLVGITNIFAKENKVFDYSMILNKKEENIINSKIEKFEKDTNIKFYVITVSHHDYKDTDNYLDKYYKKKLKGNSIILCIDLKNNNLEINTYGDKANKIKNIQINEIKDKISKKNTYYKKINSAIGLMKSEYVNGYHENLLFIILIILIPSVILGTFIVFIIMLVLNKNKIIEEDVSYIKIDTLEITKREDKFIKTYTKKKRIKK